MPTNEKVEALRACLPGANCGACGFPGCDGYAAGYYTYLWAQVLDCDGFEVFQKHGIFDPTTAAKLKHLLESGNDEDPMVLYKKFAGHKPSPNALLRDKGLK